MTRDSLTAPVLPHAWLRFSRPGPAARPARTLVGLRGRLPTAEPGDPTSSQALSSRSPAGVRLQPAKVAQRPAHLNRWRPRSSLPCLESSRAAETTSQRSRAPDEDATIETETGSAPSPTRHFRQAKPGMREVFMGLRAGGSGEFKFVGRVLFAGRCTGFTGYKDDESSVCTIRECAV